MSESRHPARCMQCGYELVDATGAAACSECGAPVVLSLLRAQRNRLGRDDWVPAATIALRATLMIHGAMLVYATTLAFPQWLIVPLTITRGDTDQFVALAVMWSGWAAMMTWLVFIALTRRDAARASLTWNALLVLVPIADAIVRTYAIDEWFAPMPNAGLRLVSWITPALTAATAWWYLTRLTSSLQPDHRGARAVTITFAALLLAIAVLLVCTCFGVAFVPAGGRLSGEEGIVLLAEIAFLSAFVHRLRFVARAIGARADVTLIPHGWIDARAEERLENA